MISGLSTQAIGAAIVTALLVFYVLDRVLRLSSSDRRRAPGKWHRAEKRSYAPNRRDSADQLRDVLGAKFSAKKVMNLSEYRVFRAAEAEIRALGNGCRVFSQTCLGEVIQSPDPLAHSAINSKRVDVLIISRTGYPIVAVEYQGGAHYQRDAAARDAVKKEALRRAGVEYVEIMDFHAEEATRQLIRDAIKRKSTPPPQLPAASGTATSAARPHIVTTTSPAAVAARD